MGGLGSGRWRTASRQQIVEACHFISVCDLPDFECQFPSFPLTVRWHEGEIYGHLPCKFIKLKSGCLGFYYGSQIDSASSAIELGVTPTHANGVRQCFMCPVTKDGETCGRLCRKLYAPPGAVNFGCRTCHRLSYASRQRRAERLARVEASSAQVEKEMTDLLASEDNSFDTMLRAQRRASYAISDLVELLLHSAGIYQR